MKETRIVKATAATARIATRKTTRTETITRKRRIPDVKFPALTHGTQKFCTMCLKTQAYSATGFFFFCSTVLQFLLVCFPFSLWLHGAISRKAQALSFAFLATLETFLTACLEEKIHCIGETDCQLIVQ